MLGHVLHSSFRGYSVVDLVLVVRVTCPRVSVVVCSLYVIVTIVVSALANPLYGSTVVGAL